MKGCLFWLTLPSTALAWEGDVASEPIATILGSAAEEHLRGPALSADLDRDGVPELLVGNHQGTAEGYGAGEVHLLSAPFAGELDLVAQPAVYGDAEHDYLGVDLAFNRHGLWLGADRTGLTGREPGLVALFRAPGALLGQVAASEADLTLVGDDNGDALGRQLEVGDFDGDGVDDLAVASPVWDGDGQQRKGAVWWVMGGLDDAAGTLAIDEAAAASLSGDGARTWLGWRLESPGDLDGDGTDDLVVGALGEGATFGGRLYVVSAPGRAPVDAWQSSVAGARAGEGLDGGDLDGDGVAELLIGSPWVGRGAGQVWLVSGAPSGVEDLNDAALATTPGAPGEGLGAEVALGPALLAGAPYGGLVRVYDSALSELGLIAGPLSLGGGVAWLDDVDGDAVPDALLLAPDHGLTRDHQGVGWLLSGAAISGDGVPASALIDADNDGSPAEEDCDDGDPLRATGAAELCRDDVDNDCDWEVDEEVCERSVCGLQARPSGLWALVFLALFTRRRLDRGERVTSRLP